MKTPSLTEKHKAPKSPLVVLLGPTAVGKTEIAIELAKHMEGEIVSADSRLFYRGMDIGTAKPTVEQQREVVHHLVDIANPGETISLAQFQDMAHTAIASIHARQRLPFLVGGTGQYVRAVIHGWDLPRVEPDPRLRAALESWAKHIGKEGLHARLAVLDPPAASSIDFRNLRRTVRALEVIFRSGRRFSEQRGTGQSPYRTLLIGLSRERTELYARIDARINTMLEQGLLDEVRSLLEAGYSPDLPALSAIGYRELVRHVEGKIGLDEAVAEMKRNTRIFVRRQANWFKSDDPSIHWFQAAPGVVEAVEKLIHHWIADSRNLY